MPYRSSLTLDWLHGFYLKGKISPSVWEEMKHVLIHWRQIEEENELIYMNELEESDKESFRDGYEAARVDWPVDRFAPNQNIVSEAKKFAPRLVKPSKLPENDLQLREHYLQTASELLLDLAEPQTPTNNEHPIP